MKKNPHRLGRCGFFSRTSGNWNQIMTMHESAAFAARYLKIDNMNLQSLIPWVS